MAKKTKIVVYMDEFSEAKLLAGDRAEWIKLGRVLKPDWTDEQRETAWRNNWHPAN